MKKKQIKLCNFGVGELEMQKSVFIYIKLYLGRFIVYQLSSFLLCK